MTRINVYFSLNNRRVNYVEYQCNQNCTIREFLGIIEQYMNKPKYIEDDSEYGYNLEDGYSVYLKNRKLEEEDYLDNYLDDLKKNILFITDGPKPYENLFHLINLEDYGDIQYISEKVYLKSFREESDTCVHCFKAVDKKTKKEVFIEVYDPDPAKLIKIYTNIKGYAAQSSLNHNGIVKMLGFRYPLTEKEKRQTKLNKIQIVKDKTKQKVDLTGFIFVFEYIKNGGVDELMKDYLDKKQTPINPTIRSKIIYGVASIMKFIHERSAIYRNLSFSHILVDEKFEPKITGFELCKILYYNFGMTMAIGVPCYMAPEIFMDGDEEYDISVDVYAYGMFLYRMFSNKIEFADKKPIRSSRQLMLKIGHGTRPKRPENIPDHYWELIQRCWKQNPSERPTFDEIVELLKNDKYALEEFGVKTNLKELHEYQERIDKGDLIQPSSTSSDQQEDINQIRGQFEELKSIFHESFDHPNQDNCFIDDDDEKHHQVLSKIGEGATSVTYKIFDERTGQIMCKKILKLVNNVNIAIKIAQDALKEFEVLSKLNHPSICRAIGINTSETVTDSNISVKKDSEITTIALFLEFEDYSITDFLNSMNNTLKTKIVVEIAHAMNFIHKNGLIHRDLKIDNIRLNCIFEAKIIDFGLVRIHEFADKNYSFVQDSLTKGVGTFAYMSPEMLNEEAYDYKTDVYSFGVVVYFLFVGSLPRQNLKDKMVGKKIELPEQSQSISKCCIELISKCLSHKPSERPSFEEILKFISDNNYMLASFVDQKIVSKRDRELQFFEKWTK